MSDPRPARRFRDPRVTKDHFVDDVLVRCPGCGRIAHVMPDPSRPAVRPAAAPRRLTCRRCGLSRSSDGGSASFWRGGAGPVTDPYVDAPLWLQLESRHGLLWAYNLEHLSLLRDYVAAGLRERPADVVQYDLKMTLVARLPRWIKQAKHRDEVLRLIDRLRDSVVEG